MTNPKFQNNSDVFELKSYFKICNLLFGILAFEQGIHLPAICMAEGESEGVGNIVGLRDGGKLQDAFDHNLHLFFFGATIAGQGLFHLERSILEESNAQGLKRQENGAAGLTDGDDRFLIFEEKYLLHRCLVGSVPCGNFSEVFGNFGDSFRKGDF